MLVIGPEPHVEHYLAHSDLEVEWISSTRWQSESNGESLANVGMNLKPVVDQVMVGEPRPGVRYKFPVTSSTLHTFHRWCSGC